MMTGVKRLNYWPSGLVIMNREKLVSRQGTNAEGKGKAEEENGPLSNNDLREIQQDWSIKVLEKRFCPFA